MGSIWFLEAKSFTSFQKVTESIPRLGMKAYSCMSFVQSVLSKS